MTRFYVGEKVKIIGAIAGFNRQTGTVASIADPAPVYVRSREDALLELRLYRVLLDDGRRFQFRGKELTSISR